MESKHPANLSAVAVQKKNFLFYEKWQPLNQQGPNTMADTGIRLFVAKRSQALFKPIAQKIFDFSRHLITRFAISTLLLFCFQFSIARGSLGFKRTMFKAKMRTISNKIHGEYLTAINDTRPPPL